MRPSSRALRAARLLPAALALASCEPSTAPGGSGSPTHDLLFVARVHGFDELFTLPLAGGVPQPAVAGEANAFYPAGSPDGRLVAFTDLADDEIWIAERGGARLRNVSQHLRAFDHMPDWAPDGTRLAFASDRSGALDLYVVNADGSGLRNLMAGDLPAAHVDDAPAWSPDGSRLAFSSDRAVAGRRSIWTMRADGTDLVQVTSDPTARDYEPAWSPDGRRIVFRRSRVEGGVARTDLAIVSATGGTVAELRQAGTERSPSWSPDGRWIAYSADVDGTGYRLFTMRPDGSATVERAGGAAYGHHVIQARWLRRR